MIVTAHATTDLRIVVDVTPPNPDELKLDLEADGLRAGLLGRIANVDGELRRFVAKYVARELEKPHIVATRNIDVGVSIDVAWAGMAPRTWHRGRRHRRIGWRRDGSPSPDRPGHRRARSRALPTASSRGPRWA